MAKVNWLALINRFTHRLFGAPFKNLPPEFGDTVPPELRVFEAEAELAQSSERAEPVERPARDGRSSPALQNHSPERR
jgi:hypothetical protein